jgi:hypothetical protein
MPSAKLTVSGVTFGDSTVLNSKYGIVPQGSTSIFYQASAPTGWSKNSTATVNDKALRVVNGATGGSAGGTTAFSTIFPTSTTPVTVSNIPLSGTTGSTTLTEGQLPAHTHPNGGFTGLTPGGGDVGAAAGWTRSSPITGPGPGSGGGSHTHPWSGTANFSSTFDLRLAYIDVIVCSFI